jgi:hypothetical protein
MWAATITTDGLGLRRLVAAARTSLKFDVDAARAWIIASPLPEEKKRQLLAAVAGP